MLVLIMLVVDHNFKSLSVTAPSDALVTCAAYFATSKSGAAFLPGANALCNCLKGLVTQPFFPVACVVAVSLIELAEKFCHAQRAKRIGERLVTGGPQFNGIECVSFHTLILV